MRQGLHSVLCLLAAVASAQAAISATATRAASDKLDIATLVTTRKADGFHEVVLDITLTNNSMTAYSLDVGAPIREYNIQVVDSAGKTVELTDAGKNEISAPGSLKVKIRILKPGGGTVRETVDLQHYFKITKPEKYKVVVKRTVENVKGEKAHLASTCDFEIKHEE